MKVNGQVVKIILTLLFVCIWVAFLVAQSPRNLLQDINASNGFTNVSNIEATFNNGRRQEEQQLNLPTNSISNLNLPSDAIWNGMSDNAKLLMLINDERTSRAGINYGDGPVKGLPFAGVAQNIDNVSNAYAQTLFNADAFTHTYGGTSPSSRISGAYASNCREFTSRSENLFAAGSSANTGFPRAVSRAIYGFNYDDASSGWGHREMSLLQDRSLSGSVTSGFDNNEGSSNSEGYIGVGVYRGSNYGGFGGNINFAVVLVMNYFDPSPSCTYNVIDVSGNIVPPPNPCEVTQSVDGTITSNEVKSNKAITLKAGTVFTQATTISSPEIIIEPGFTFNSGNCIQLVDEGCAYSGTFECDTPNQGGDNSGGSNTTGTGSCTSPYELACGSSHSSTNTGRSSSWLSYGGNSGWTSGEVIYRVNIPPGNQLTASLTGLNGDLDLLAAQSCSNTVFASSTQSGNVSESLAISSSSGATIYLIIDGWQGQTSNFNLNISCAPSLKGDDNINTKSAIAIKKEAIQVMMGDVYIERQ